MSEIMEEMCNEAEYIKTIEIAHSFILMGGLSYEQIAEGTGLSVEVIKELADKGDREMPMCKTLEYMSCEPILNQF